MLRHIPSRCNALFKIPSCCNTLLKLRKGLMSFNLFNFHLFTMTDSMFSILLLVFTLSKEEWIVISHRKSWKKFLASVLVVLPSFFDKLFAINQFFWTMHWLSMKYKKLLDNRCYLKIKRYNFCHKEGLLQTHRLRIFKIKEAHFYWL